MINRLNATLVAAVILAGFGLTVAHAGNWFGTAPEQSVQPIDVAAVMADPEARLDQRLTVSGRMTDVCTNRGCWAVFENDGAMLRIVARDHGFAIPSDLRGQAVAHGVLERKALSREAAEHMVEADGADPALLDDPVSYRLVADGVRVSP